MTFGDNVRRLRVNRGMTQGDLTEATGIKLTHISRIERNETQPRIATVYKLIEALECDANSLFMDASKLGLPGVVQEAAKECNGLPKDDQITIIKIIENFCVANGLQTLLKEHRMLIDIDKSKDKYQTKPYIHEEQTEAKSVTK